MGIESKEFRDMFRPLFPTFNGISRNTARRVALKLHETLKGSLGAKINENLGKYGKVSFTTDAWSSKTAKGYMTITAHYLDEHFFHHSFMLSFKRHPTPHTGATVSQLIYSQLER